MLESLEKQNWQWKARHKNTFTKKAFVHLPAGTKKKERGTVWISDCCNHNQIAFTQSNSFHISFAVGLHFLLVRSARIHLQHCHHEYWHAKTFYSFRKHSEDPPFAPQHLRKEEFLHGSMGFWYSLSICVRDTYGMSLFNFHSNSGYLLDLNWLIILGKSSVTFPLEVWWYTLLNCYQLANSW